MTNLRGMTLFPFERKFRVIPGAEFLKTFASDRSHMLTQDGRWMSPPPVYPPIKTEGMHVHHELWVNYSDEDVKVDFLFESVD